MKKLYLLNTDEVLIAQLKVADHFFSRAIGLLGRKSLRESEGLLITEGNSIHTFFMRFSIAVILLDKDFKILKIYNSISPFKMTMPKWGVKNIIEISAHNKVLEKIQIGDQLYVGN